MSKRSSSSAPNKCTVYVGNIDPKATECHVLKLVQPFGEVVRFDFMYSTIENGEKMPRGYAFVTYRDHVAAARAVERLHGVRLLSKVLRVQPSSTTLTGPRALTSSSKASLPLAVSMSADTCKPKNVDKQRKIREMEEKLKTLSRGEDFQLQVPGSGTSAAGPSSSRKHAHERGKPYDRVPNSSSATS